MERLSRSRKRRAFRPLPGVVGLLAVGLLVVGLPAAVVLLPDASRAQATIAPPPWERTETRADCTAYDGLRRPLFGDQHVHTALSHDAYNRGTRGGPREAYDFAQGATVQIADENGGQTRTATIDRPLDWAMAADHSEFFGEIRECSTPSSGAFGDPLCVETRDPFLGSIASWIISVVDGSMGLPAQVKRPDLCSLPGVGCDASRVSVWEEVQAAAEEAYDRSDSCSFSSFVGYEWSADLQFPLVLDFVYRSSFHRNVLFRNAEVPPAAESAVGSALAIQAVAPLDGDPFTSVQRVENRLWDFLEQDCTQAGTGCQALAIPHNTNKASGLAFQDPVDRAEALRRRSIEPIVEMFQQKQGSECRYDRLAGAGVGTSDELCTFEQETARGGNAFGGDVPVEEYFRRNMMRNTLKDGLAIQESLGVNPFQYGFIASTDNHLATPGNTTEDESWEGSRAVEDATPALQIAREATLIERNPGGLAVVWAEENSRDAIFSAIRRREVYGTSGGRQVLRFFAGDLPRNLCGKADMVDRAYRDGVPMGSELGGDRRRRSPRFLVSALKDPGTAIEPGTDLQAIQIVKGWVDAQGATQERVYDVAGDRNNGAGVDPLTCATTGVGASDLCTVWEDPDFDPDQRAFYYARVLDNPVCRWSTRLCQSEGVNPLSSTCDAEAAAAGPGFENCCIREEDEPFYSPIVQERAWSSPIWYSPDSMARVRAKVKKRSSGDTLSVSGFFHAFPASDPASLDPAAEDLTLRISDDDDIYTALLPAGSLAMVRPGLYRFKDRSASLFDGLQSVTLKVRSTKTTLKVRAKGIDLSAADTTDHFVTVEMSLGDFSTSHMRLWKAGGTTLRVR